VSGLPVAAPVRHAVPMASLINAQHATCNAPQALEISPDGTATVDPVGAGGAGGGNGKVAPPPDTASAAGTVVHPELPFR